MLNKAIISVGSNIDPEANIEAAKTILSREQRILATSKFVRTKPCGLTGQADFINGALSIETALDIKTLAVYLKDVEARLGRGRLAAKDAPRTIDLDLVVFNGEIVGLDFGRYDFVRNAVLELLPELGS